ncbi:MAG TPA: hypothetical protein VL966_18415 [Alphaproteobacteria bacterium]|nr:hypothetical protein [Alphaproteobacteria bacterium]
MAKRLLTNESGCTERPARARDASKLSTADLNNLMRALEIDVVALTEILVPRGHPAGALIRGVDQL